MDSIIYSYLNKNYTLKYKTSIDILYIYDLNGEAISRSNLFEELKTVFSINDEDDFFNAYAVWVNDKKKMAVEVC